MKYAQTHSRLCRYYSTNSSKLNKVVICGGGIAGLSAAWFLKQYRPHLAITVIEQHSHLGGWVHSNRLTSGYGLTTELTRVHHKPIKKPYPVIKHLVEIGPRTLRPSGIVGASTLEMIYSLGLSDTIMTVSKTSPAAKNRFIYYKNALNQLPATLFGMLTSKQPILKGMLKSLIKEPFQPKRSIQNTLDSVNDETIESFVVRRLGKDAADHLVSAIVHGIYAGDISKLSARSTINFLWEMEQSFGSITAGILASLVGLKPKTTSTDLNTEAFKTMLQQSDARKFIESVQATASIYSFRGGMQTLTDRLVHRLKELGVTFLQAKCTHLNHKPDCIQVQLNNGLTLDADHVVSAVSSQVLAQLLLPSDMTDIMTYNPSVTVGVVNLVYKGADALPVQGFGYLVPRSETANTDIIGCIFDSSALPDQDSPQDFTRLTVMMGGHMFAKKFGFAPNDKENADLVSGNQLSRKLEKIAVETVQAHLNIPVEKLDAVKAVVLKECIPQYQVGHADRVARLMKYMESDYSGRISLCGSSYYGVGVNDCVHGSRMAVSRLLELNTE
ncbi:condensin complex non-SMC subunit Cnd1 [Batrachochytrium dendrobatidis]|nr:condensin complex non-SMC subunit Cnd1 [Batrachochytrium dendrobatidis]KAK5671611.1 condensin complex non-SMC subunit Cnd1 [Batrachochytrium dendrobatidis]